VRCFEARPPDLAAACADALAAARSESARATALVAAAGAPGDPARDLCIAVELAGDAAGVDRTAGRLEAQLGAVEVSPEAFDRVREQQGALPGAGGLRFRIAALPSRFGELLAALHAADAETLCYPGLRLVFAGFPLPKDGGEGAAERAFGCVEAAVARAEGGCVCEAAPAWAKAEREMYGDVAALLPLFEALKTRFDPGGVLNPGRFAGGL
jgi:glycolate oxidase FAD binding subunit